jgi:hypothetical protein
VVDVHLPEVETRLPQEQIWKEFEQLRPALLGALLTLLVRDFDQPRYLLPNRKTEKQKIEESVTAFMQTAFMETKDEWKGTMSDLKDLLRLDVSPKALHQAIERMPSLQLTAARTGQARKWVLTRTVTPITPQPREQSASAVGCNVLTAACGASIIGRQLQTAHPEHAPTHHNCETSSNEAAPNNPASSASRPARVTRGLKPAMTELPDQRTVELVALPAAGACSAFI